MALFVPVICVCLPLQLAGLEGFFPQCFHHLPLIQGHLGNREREKKNGGFNMITVNVREALANFYRSFLETNEMVFTCVSVSNVTYRNPCVSS